MIHEYDNMLKGSSWKGGLIDEQMGNFRSEMEATSKSQTEMLEITGKKTVKETKNIFVRLLSKLDTDEGKTVKT